MEVNKVIINLWLLVLLFRAEYLNWQRVCNRVDKIISWGFRLFLLFIFLSLSIVLVLHFILVFSGRFSCQFTIGVLFP